MDYNGIENTEFITDDGCMIYTIGFGYNNLDPPYTSSSHNDYLAVESYDLANHTWAYQGSRILDSNTSANVQVDLVGSNGSYTERRRHHFGWDAPHLAPERWYHRGHQPATVL